MADINAKLNVKNETDYTRINLVTKSDIIDFNKTGTDLNSTNVQDAIVELNKITIKLNSDIKDVNKNLSDSISAINQNLNGIQFRIENGKLQFRYEIEV